MEISISRLTSKLPFVGTSIFATMSSYAQSNNAINLSQGFPDFPVSDKLISLVNKYMKKGFNQYAPMPGVMGLREQISLFYNSKYNVNYCPDSEITITSGATEALFSVISSVVHQGDEVVIFEPAYDSYAPAIQLQGGVVKYAQLEGSDYSINWTTLPKLISERTRLIILNSPHNPTGGTIKESDLQNLTKLIKSRDIMVLSDEVYEHLIFDKLQHHSVCKYSELAERSFIVGSFGKTFHATGWKCGFVLAPKLMTMELRKIHQFVTFAVNTPVQYAISDFMKDPANYDRLPDFYQEKRDYFLKLISGSRFKFSPTQGTYFQLLDYSCISDEKEFEFAVKLTEDHKIATIPLSPFYGNGINNSMLRVCFAKTNETLEKAAEILCKI